MQLLNTLHKNESENEEVNEDDTSWYEQVMSQEFMKRSIHQLVKEVNEGDSV